MNKPAHFNDYLIYAMKGVNEGGVSSFELVNNVYNLTLLNPAMYSCKNVLYYLAPRIYYICRRRSIARGDRGTVSGARGGLRFEAWCGKGDGPPRRCGEAAGSRRRACGEADDRFCAP